MLLSLPLTVLLAAAPGPDATDRSPPPAQKPAADDLASSDDGGLEHDHSALEDQGLHDDDLEDEDDLESADAVRCRELSGPERRQARHATWRERHQLDVTYGAESWEIAVRGEVPSEIRSGLFEGAEIVDVQPVTDEGGGPLEWVAVVKLDGELADLCDAERVSLRLDDGFGRSAHVIALHPEGVLLRARDRGLVFLSAEDSEQIPEIELVYSSSFELVNMPKATKSKKKKRRKKRRRRRRRRR